MARCCGFRLWVYTLFVINTLVALLGIACIVLSIVIMTNREAQAIAETLPYRIFSVAVAVLAFGLLVILFSFLGIQGARKAADRHSQGKFNFCLLIYFLVMLCFLIAELAIAGVALYLVNELQGDAYEETFKKDLRENWNEKLPENKDLQKGVSSGGWAHLQEDMDCCFMFVEDQFNGNIEFYGSNAACVNTTASYANTACIDQIKGVVIRNLRGAGGISLAMGIFLLLGVFASAALTCFKFDGYSAGHH